MCSQEFPRSVRFLEDVFFPECVGPSSEQYRTHDHHQLLAQGNLPRLFGKFGSELTLVIEFGAHERVPWLSERRQVSKNLHSGLNSIDKFIYFLHRNNIPSLLPQYFIQYPRCRGIENKETNARNRGTTLSLFRICDFFTFASLFSRYDCRLAAFEHLPTNKEALPFDSERIHGFSNEQFHNSIELGREKKL